MPVETIETPTEQPKPFDFAAYKAASSEGRPYTPEPEAKTEERKPADPAKPPVAAAGADDDEEEDPKSPPVHIPRSIRRQISNRDREIGAAKEREAALQRQIDALMAREQPKAAAKTPEDPEPDRANFANDREYDRALGRWEGRQGAKEVLTKKEETTQQQAADAEYQQIVAAADAKAVEDRKLIADYDAIVAQAETMGDQLSFPQDGLLARMIQVSDDRASVLVHFVKHPDVLRKLVDLGDGPILIREFGRLEARVEKLYTQKAAETKESEPVKLTAAERDAKKAKPSESVSAKGGTAASAAIPMFLEGTNTLNPAWKAERNANNGVRP